MSDLDRDGIRDHYRLAREVYEALALVDEYPTIGNNDFIGWYIKRDTTDADAIQQGYLQRGRVAQLDRDFETLVDRIDRTLYAITSYKTPEAFERWVNCATEDNETEWEEDKPTPDRKDLRAVPAWGDIDLADDLKEQRGDLDRETKDLIEETLAAYVDEYADLYGSRDAVFALDSVGGAYIFGSPSATLPIAEEFEGDDDAIARIYDEFISRSNDWLEEAEERINERIEGAADVIHPDWVNNYNRQYKAPLSVHAKHDAVVTPLDIDAPDYSITPFSEVDDELIETAKDWAEQFTATDHTDLIDGLIETLWPDEYESEGSWQAALHAWVDEQRRIEEEQAQRRKQALEDAQQRRIEGIEGLPITPHITDVYEAIDRLDIEQVAERTIVHQWTDQASGKTDTSGRGKRAFIPIWGPNASGTANYINRRKGTWVDTGADHHGTAVEMALIAEGGWTRGDIADGSDWARGVNHLRGLGFEIPLWTPDAETGDNDQMPYWALINAAIALGVATADDLVEREGDDGDTYMGLPGDLYDAALEAVEEAGLVHGREPLHNHAEELQRLLERYVGDGDGPSGSQRYRIGRLLGQVAPDEFVEFRQLAADVLETTPEAIDRHRGLEQHRADRGRILVEGGKTWILSGVPLRQRPILNFEIEIRSYLNVKGENPRAEIAITKPGGEPMVELVEPKVFTKVNDFEDHILSIDFGLTFDAPGNWTEKDVLKELTKYVDKSDAPRRKGTHHLGLHGDEWVTPDGSLTADGWTDNPSVVYLERNLGIERAITLPPDRSDYDTEDVAEILRQLPKTRDPIRFIPVIGWFYSAPFRPHIYDMEGEFNLLNVTGDTGSGKTTSLRYLWRCFGMKGEPRDCADTRYVLLSSLASTNSWPVWFDEYKPSDMEGWRVRRFHDFIRKAATGSVSDRGKQDLSTESFELQAPTVISGEQQIQGPSERRRSLLVSFKSDTTDQETETSRAYKRLAGEAVVEDGELKIPDDCPDPTDHALAYFRFVTSLDRAAVEERWQAARQQVVEHRDSWDERLDLDDLEIQALQTVIFGWGLYCEFAENHGVDHDELPSESVIDRTIRELAYVVGPSGRKTHLEGFIELISRAASRGALERGVEYELVREGREDEELRFHISKTYDAISRYVRDHDLQSSEDLFGSANDYRKRIKERYERSDDEMIVSYTQRTPPVGKCAGIMTSVAAEELDFDRTAFGAIEEGEGEDPNAHAVPIRDLRDTRGYETITAHVSVWHEDPDHPAEVTGVLSDASGVIDLVCWANPAEFDAEIKEERTYRFENIRVGEYNAAPQVEPIPNVTTIHEIETGAGHTGAAGQHPGEPDGHQVYFANGGTEEVTNGGQDMAEPEQDDEGDDSTDDGPDLDPDDFEGAQGKVATYIAQNMGSYDVIDKGRLAIELDLKEDDINHALEKLSERGAVIHEDGQYRVI